MEHLRRWGAIGEVEEAGFPRTRSRDVVFATAVLGYELEREPFEADAIRPCPQFSPQKHELCPQSFFDPVLQRVAGRRDCATIYHGQRLESFEDNGNGVLAEVLDVASGGRRRISARYLVGADGANSLVARELDIGTRNPTTLACSSNLFIESPELSRLATELRGYRYILLNPSGIWASMANMDGRNLWRLQILGGSDWPHWTDEKADSAIRRGIGCQVPYVLKSIVPWQRRELIVDQYSKGRCFLIGDSAHQFSPTGGYGMNTGIGDAVDLSWKLDATLKGWGGPKLLESYDQERRPIAIRNAKRGTFNFERMRNIGSHPALLDHSETGNTARRDVGRSVRAGMADEWDSMDVHLGYSYCSSPLICSEDLTAPDPRPVPFVQNAKPGSRAPHAWLRSGKSTLDLFGQGFTLLLFNPHVDCDGLQRAAKQRSVPLRVEMINNAEIANLYQRAMVLVRPDGHVAWRGNVEPAEPLAVIDQVRGAPAVFRQSQPELGIQVLADE